MTARQAAGELGVHCAPLQSAFKMYLPAQSRTRGTRWGSLVLAAAKRGEAGLAWPCPDFDPAAFARRRMAAGPHWPASNQNEGKLRTLRFVRTPWTCKAGWAAGL